MVLSVIPRQGDLTTLRIVKYLIKDFGFSEDEFKLLSLETVDGHAKWDASKDFEKEILIGDVALKIIHDAFTELDRKKQLNLQFVELYDRLNIEKELRESKKS